LKEIDNYYKLKSKYNKTKIQIFFAKFNEAFSGFLFLQFISVISYIIWFFFFGESHLSEFGYTFKEVLWMRDTGDGVLVPIFFINLAIPILFFPIVLKIIKKKGRDFWNFSTNEDFKLLSVVICFFFMMFSFANAHFGTLSLIFISFCLILSFTTIYSKFNKIYDGRILINLDSIVKNNFNNILKNNDELQHLKENKQKHRKLYKKVCLKIVEENQDELFDLYCEKNNEKIIDEKRYNEEKILIENT